MNAELARLLREGRWVQPTSATGVLGIGAVAFLLSYDALHSLALASGVRPGLARGAGRLHRRRHPHGGCG